MWAGRSGRVVLRAAVLPLALPVSLPIAALACLLCAAAAALGSAALAAHGSLRRPPPPPRPATSAPQGPAPADPHGVDPSTAPLPRPSAASAAAAAAGGTPKTSPLPELVALQSQLRGQLLGLRLRSVVSDRGPLREAELVWRVHSTGPGVVALQSPAGTLLGIGKSGVVTARRLPPADNSGDRWQVREVAGSAAQSGKSVLCEFVSAATGRLLAAQRGGTGLNTANTSSAATRFLVRPSPCVPPGRAVRCPAARSPLRRLNRTAMGSSGFAAARLLSERTMTCWAALPRPIAPIFYIGRDDQHHAALCARTAGVRCDTTAVETRADCGDVPTYRGLYAAAFASDTAAPAAIYSNADILFTEGLSDLARAAVRFAAGRRLLAVGQRVNVNIPAGFNSSAPGAVEGLVRGRRLYQRNAEDWFLASRSLADWGRLPPFALGGIAFDNWFVSRATRDPGCVTIDATSVAPAVHQNHGRQRKSSHHSAQSRLNRRLAIKHGGWKRGKVDDTRYIAARVGANVFIVEPAALLHDKSL
eukprot:TRINITY_DN16040_c0_g1_i1.p1 TRINITY_DN16040_c0_g1~~TRINITY_DN16040_c0_g1_i1.p1  ORF type:complete len:532 (+),score=50.27 TRINITY_DN16040_c0_g1_i1:84-1679(+)